MLVEEARNAAAISATDAERLVEEARNAAAISATDAEMLLWKE